MSKSAVILAGGSSSRLNDDKGIVALAGKPLLTYVVNSVEGLVDETVIVTSSKERANAYAKLASSSNVRFAVDEYDSKGPLIGALTGFKSVNGEYTLLLPVDTPFVSREVLSLLFELCIGKVAAVPRWTSNEIEPLHAVYRTKEALKAAEEAFVQGEVDMQAMVNRLRGVRYISTLVIEQLDPDLRTFFNVNTALDLKKAATMIKHEKNKNIVHP
ncbi:MAG: molybdenum cofactor guanylyltransferase [Candidatus Bathyarchaeota archaeon]|nr:molybdenum cofactor guanylyltransferase [Candidatus Bathyarchaeota archaeon]